MASVFKLNTWKKSDNATCSSIPSDHPIIAHQACECDCSDVIVYSLAWLVPRGLTFIAANASVYDASFFVGDHSQHHLLFFRDPRGLIECRERYEGGRKNHTILKCCPCILRRSVSLRCRRETRHQNSAFQSVGQLVFFVCHYSLFFACSSARDSTWRLLCLCFLFFVFLLTRPFDHQEVDSSRGHFHG